MIEKPDMLNVIIIKAPYNNEKFKSLLKEIFIIDDDKVNEIVKNNGTPIGAYPVDISITRGNMLYSKCENLGMSIELDYQV